MTNLQRTRYTLLLSCGLLAKFIVTFGHWSVEEDEVNLSETYRKRGKSEDVSHTNSFYDIITLQTQIVSPTKNSNTLNKRDGKGGEVLTQGSFKSLGLSEIKSFQTITELGTEQGKEDVAVRASEEQKMERKRKNTAELLCAREQNGNVRDKGIIMKQGQITLPLNDDGNSAVNGKTGTFLNADGGLVGEIKIKSLRRKAREMKDGSSIKIDEKTTMFHEEERKSKGKVGRKKESEKDVEDDEVTVEVVEDSSHVNDEGLVNTPPPFLPTPDKFISPKDIMGIIEKGLEATKVVANLVSLGLGSVRQEVGPKRAEGPSRARPSSPQEGTQPNPLLKTLAGFFKLMGVNRAKIENLTINSLVVLINLVVTNLLGKQADNNAMSETPPEGSMYNWIFNHSPPQVNDLVKLIQEPGVEERIIGLVRERSVVETDCVQLLLCRLAPVIWGMQRAITQPPPQDWAAMSPVDRMYAYFPSLDSMIAHRPRCEIRFPNCRIKYQHLYKDLEAKLTQT